MKEKLKLSSPWEIYYKKIESMFKKDKSVRTEFDNENMIIKLFVEGTDKADALDKLLPKEKVFGNITVKIEVIPANNDNPTDVELFNRAFKDNPIFSYVSNGNKEITAGNTYVVFKKDVVQYYNDSLNDINGVCSTLYQDIAKDIFEKRSGVYFCTNIDDYDECPW